MPPSLLSVAVSAVISGGFALWTARKKREAQLKELLFAKSVELAKAKVDFLVTVGEKTPHEPVIADYAVYAEMYYWLLTELHDNGSLPKDWRERIAAKLPHIR